VSGPQGRTDGGLGPWARSGRPPVPTGRPSAGRIRAAALAQQEGPHGPRRLLLEVAAAALNHRSNARVPNERGVSTPTGKGGWIHTTVTRTLAWPQPDRA
jgi:hypothetical protein